MPTRSTLCFIEKDEKFLMLKKAAELFGGGKWNAPGGKLNDGESFDECAVREAFEETGLKLGGVEERGILKFFESGKFAWDVHVFVSNNFEGEMKQGSEGELKWIEKNNMPFDDMWADDFHWFPFLIDGKKFEGTFYFTENFQKLIRWSVKEMSA
jgi:8-oxo-dGTP pyrophosphatase MutT (NUDIX family)